MQELDQDKVCCNLGFLEDEFEEGFFDIAEKTNRLKSKSDFMRRPSDNFNEADL